MKTLDIRKKESGLVCWKIDATDISYNTELHIADGLTVLINVDGEAKVAMGGIKTLGSIINPSKERKAFGGNRALNCTLIAMDEGAEYSAMWGVGLQNATDKMTGGMRNIQSNGRYFFKIYSMQDFIKNMKVEARAALTEEDVKILLREKIHEVIRGCLAQAVGAKSVLDLQGELSNISNVIVERLNKALANCGVAFISCVINLLGYAADEEENLAKIKSAQLDTTLAKIKNQATKDELEIKSKFGAVAADVAPEKKGRLCAKCNTENIDTAIYCSRCGEKLI